MAAQAVVTSTRMVARSGLLLPNALVWPVSAALTAQRACEVPGQRALPATVTGHTTPAVRDVGGASVRVAFDDMGAVRDGGYLLGLRAPRSAAGSAVPCALPAIAAVPGRTGPDRERRSREGLAELMVLCRPISAPPPAARAGAGAEEVSFLDDGALRALYPLGAAVEVHVIARVEDFFVGVNAGTWLKVRMRQISLAAQAHLGAVEGLGGGAGADVAAGAAALLRGSGLALAEGAEEAAGQEEEWLFNDSPGGNTGVSGQRAWDPAGPPPLPRLPVADIVAFERAARAAGDAPAEHAWRKPRFA